MAPSSLATQQLAREVSHAVSQSGSVYHAWRTLRARDSGFDDIDLDDDGHPESHTETVVVIVCSILGSMLVVLLILACCSCLFRRWRDTRRRARLDQVDGEMAQTGGFILPATAANLARPPATHPRGAASTISSGTTLRHQASRTATTEAGHSGTSHSPMLKDHKTIYEHHEHAV
ncbi:hypothetical protein HDZ31DRAFT_80741 [Schizophyllum fasciatum]